MGIEMDLTRVPQREAKMTAYEMMLSESQERMLLVATRGREQEVFDVFHKWGLDAVEIGRVTDDGKLRILLDGAVAGEIPAHALAEEGPRYERPVAAPNTSGAPKTTGKVPFASDGADLTENFRRLLAAPTIASKKWVTDQYDSMVRTNTRFGPGAGDAAVLRLKETKRALETPITGGNVSFYNETLGNPIYPTPIIGVLGLMEDAEFAIGSGFRNAGDKIFVLDGAADKSIASAESFSSSEYAKEIHGIVSGMPPKIDLAAEKRLIDCLVHLAAEKTIASAHDISDGGVAVSLAESCFGSENLSAQVSLDTLGTTLNAETAAYGERGARAVVSVPPSSVVRLRAIAAENGVNATEIGTVAAGDFRIQYGTKTVIQGSLASFHRPWAKSLQEAIENG